MTMFADVFHTLKPNSILEQIENASDNDVLLALKKDKLNFDDFLVLLSSSAKKYISEMAKKSQKITKAYFGNNIGLYIPLYISNECTNICEYCGFRADNDTPRTNLKLDEIETELKTINSLGMRQVLLLTGESKKAVPVEYIEEVIKLTKKYASYISLEIYPIDEDEYNKLAMAGASGITVYQETYDKETYDRVHINGKKKVPTATLR